MKTDAVQTHIPEETEPFSGEHQESVLLDTQNRMVKTGDRLPFFGRPIPELHQLPGNETQEGYESDSSSIFEGEVDKVIIRESFCKTSPIRMCDLEDSEIHQENSPLHMKDHHLVSKHDYSSMVSDLLPKMSEKVHGSSEGIPFTEKNDGPSTSDSPYQEISSISCPEDSLDEDKKMSLPLTPEHQSPVIPSNEQENHMMVDQITTLKEDTGHSEIFGAGENGGILNADDYKSFFAKLAEWEEKNKETNEKILSSIRNKQLSPQTVKLYSVDSIMTPMAFKGELLIEKEPGLKFESPSESESEYEKMEGAEQSMGMVMPPSSLSSGPTEFIKHFSEGESYTKKLYAVGAYLKSLSLSVPEQRKIITEHVDVDLRNMLTKEDRQQKTVPSPNFLFFFLLFGC